MYIFKKDLSNQGIRRVCSSINKARKHTKQAGSRSSASLCAKYLKYTGAIGKSKTQNMRLEFDADMYRKPGDKPMKAYSIQYNFYEKYTRLFLMKASKMGIPFRALHIYKNEQAIFQVKVAELFKVVNISGEILTKAETVTLLNIYVTFFLSASISLV